MCSYRVIVLSALAAALALGGCGQRSSTNFIARDEPWRANDERQCIASGMVRESPFLVGRQSLGGPGPCGALRPYEVTGLSGGRITLKPMALLRCPMVPAVERWVANAVTPAARSHLGLEVVELKVAASYACRPINHISGGRLSEHGHANALDVSAFRLSNGQWLSVKSGWRGHPAEQAFLRAVHNGACREFTTVLGPNADANHHDHFHMDLARHGRDGMMRICR